MTVLAINGGRPVRTKPFPRYSTIGAEERQAAVRVIESSVLSGFLGSWSDEFYGGPEIQALEREWAEYFGVKHALSVNSATSGLYSAVGAAGIGPGDEVIVSPYTMSASATAALVYGAIPVFADIDPDIFCITPESILERITPYTRAIIVVDLFGHPADMKGIMEVAAKHSLVVIEDAAQAPGATDHGRYAGTLGHIGVFSLNRHKTIHCGEGGIVVTDDDKLAERVQLIRNHGEAVVGDKNVEDIVNIVGFNYRMTEIEAAISREQLKKLERLVVSRNDAAAYLTRKLSSFRGLTPPVTREGIRHGYYFYSLRYNAEEWGITREKFVSALNAEGIPMEAGYTRPLYLEPLYQKRIAFGKDGFPFTYPGYKGSASYEKGMCPVTERMYYQELIHTDICHANITQSDLDDFLTALEKIKDGAAELK
jgi:perosamine synthetase